MKSIKSERFSKLMNYSFYGTTDANIALSNICRKGIQNCISSSVKV